MSKETNVARSEGDEDGYRRVPRGGPSVRTDVVDVYVFRRASIETRTGETPVPQDIEFLQVLRASEPLKGTWHPVMGHVEPGETAVGCALRELDEELGLKAQAAALVGVWALEQVHPFFISELDTIVMSPRFVAEVTGAWSPVLNDEHSAYRWVGWGKGEGTKMFMWPGQRAAVREIVASLLPVDSLSREMLAIKRR